jgi:hypothetical protein
MLPDLKVKNKTMKRNHSTIVCIVAVLAAGLTGCLKKIDILQTNNVAVAFASSGAKFVTTDITVNPKDSVFFDFTITCPKDMKYVSVQKNGTDIAKDTLTATAKNSFSAVKKFAADSITGIYTYKILAKDAAGIYLGDKTVVVTVTSDFTYYTVRVLQAPDSVAKTNKCYFSATTGKTYSYTDGAASSASIDFGYFYDTTTVGAPRHTIYALNASTFLPYDLGTWTKNATIFKRVTTPTFASITSKGALRTAGIANLASGTSSKIVTSALPVTNLTGNVILFKTVAGKYGVLTVNYTNQDSPNASTFINIDVKVEN